MKFILSFAILALVLSGCGSGSEDTTAESVKPIGGSLPITKGGNEPAQPVASGEQSALGKEELDALEKRQAEAQAAYERDRKDEQAKAQFIEVSNKYAYELMMAQYLPPKDRYPKALRIYRKVLEADPKNEEALGWKKQIEEIYKGMGREIPQ